VTTLQVVEDALRFQEQDEAERDKVSARAMLESDVLYFGRLLREETEAGRIGDVTGKSHLENVILEIVEWLRFNRHQVIRSDKLVFWAILRPSLVAFT
jgi:hypothetical protein